MSINEINEINVTTVTGDPAIDGWLSAQIDSVDADGSTRSQRYVTAMAEHLVAAGRVLSPVSAGDASDCLVDWDEDRGLLQLIVESQGATAIDMDLMLAELSRTLEELLGGGNDESDAHLLVASVAKQINGVEVLFVPMAFVDGPLQATATLAGFAARVEVWDLRRAAAAFGTGLTAEPDETRRIQAPDIDLTGRSVKALGPFESEDCEVWVTVLPGELLADIYDEHGPVLLELNVRSFLQTRGRVNKGIQDTVKDEPDRFLAYNNGLSMTATSLDVRDGLIASIHGLQIVNGGQTTASLHHAKYRLDRALDSALVQAKITIVPDGVREDLAPKVARFANAQNPVRMADFTSNNRFHIVLEELSKKVTSPSGAHWYYERSTGRYADDLARAQAVGDANGFRATYPANRRLTKLDVAKIELAWGQTPHLAALGGQKASANYMQSLAENRAGDPNERFYTDLVALAILWKAIEGAAREHGAYRAQVSAYTMALLSHLTAQRLDLDSVWQTQFVPGAIADLILVAVPSVRAALVDGAGTGNVTEWAKKPACWEAIRELKLPIPEGALRTRGTQGVPVKAGTVSVSTLPMTAEVEQAIEAIIAYGSEGWFALAAWAKDTDNLNPHQRKFAFDMGRRVARGDSRFTAKQGRYASKILADAENLGFRPSG